MTEENDSAATPSIPEEKPGRKPATLKKGGAPASLPSRRKSFSKSVKMFNKEHCNGRHGR